MKTYSAELFRWCGNHGLARHATFTLNGMTTITDHEFFLESPKTGRVIHFEEEFDEDGFDGEFRRWNSVDHEMGAGFTVTIWNH